MNYKFENYEKFVIN